MSHLWGVKICPHSLKMRFNVCIPLPSGGILSLPILVISTIWSIQLIPFYSRLADQSVLQCQHWPLFSLSVPTFFAIFLPPLSVILQFVGFVFNVSLLTSTLYVDINLKIEYTFSFVWSRRFLLCQICVICYVNPPVLVALKCCSWTSISNLLQFVRISSRYFYIQFLFKELSDN